MLESVFVACCITSNQLPKWLAFLAHQTLRQASRQGGLDRPYQDHLGGLDKAYKMRLKGLLKGRLEAF